MLHGAAPYAVHNIGTSVGKKIIVFPPQDGSHPNVYSLAKSDHRRIMYARYLHRCIDRYIRLAFQGLSPQHVVSCVQHIAHVPPTCRVRRDLRRWAEISAI